MHFIQKLKKHSLATVPFILLAAFLLLTSPKHLPLLLLIVPFVLLFWSLLVVFLGILNRLGRGGKILTKKRWTIASMLAFLPTLLLVLSSINQLTLKDILILSLLIGFVVFYASKLSFHSAQ